MDTGVEAGDDGWIGFDYNKQSFDIVNVLMEIGLIFGVIFVDKVGSDDFAAVILFKMVDEYIFVVIIVQEDVLI